MEYPVFVCWYLGNHYKTLTNKLIKSCKNLNIDFVVEELPLKKYKKEMKYVEEYLSERRYKIKCGLLWLRDLVAEIKKPVFFVHADYRVLIKPEIEIFSNMDIGYSIAQSKTGQKIIASAGIYFNNTTITRDFLNILTYKCSHIPAELPTEHGLIRTTLFEFSGYLYDESMLPIKITTWGDKKNKCKQFTLRDKVVPLKGVQKTYLISKKKKDTYIWWT